MVSSSVFLTAVVSMILGIAIGVVGLAALGKQLSPDAGSVASTQDNSTIEPQFYGKR